MSSALEPIVGPKTAKALLKAFDMRVVADLLRHYPRRYVSRSVLTPLANLQVDDHVTVMAEVKQVKLVQNRGSGRGKYKSRLLVDVTDGSADLRLTFFNQAWRQSSLRPGVRGLFSGKVGVFKGTRQLTHPDYFIEQDSSMQESSAEGSSAEDSSAKGSSNLLTSNFIAVYPATALVSSWTLAKSVDLALADLVEVPDHLPADVVANRRLLSLDEAIRLIHKPLQSSDWARAQQRLKYDEALTMQLVLARRREATSAMPARQRPTLQHGIAGAFDERLPFQLTDGQQSVGKQISSDLAGASPMHRLLQGDVGSGKTIVALRAMLQVVDSGGQAVLLAPTEVLAQQHFRVISAALGPLGQAGTLLGTEVGTQVALLTASLTTGQRRAALLDIASGAAGIVVGTHSLLAESVSYADLGLVVVDEQHRFGVEQRAALATRSGDARPHVLVMTATPIPRTIAMTVFGDLEISTLAERPPGRQITTTHVVGENDGNNLMSRVWARALDEIEVGNQVFVVCPRIADSDEIEFIADSGQNELDEAGASVQNDLGKSDSGVPGIPSTSGVPANSMHSVAEVARRLTEGPLKSVRVGILHGRLSSEEKDAVMARFASGPAATDGLDVVVSTTVIEVGIDVPNATMMVILDADRFGVSQLHQLRGRVGRGDAAGLCLLVSQAPVGSTVRERLDAVAATDDGFELARLDLTQRREGDILGAAQSGLRSSLGLLSVLADESIIVRSRQDAAAIISSDPELAKHRELAAMIADFENEEESKYLEKG